MTIPSLMRFIDHGSGGTPEVLQAAQTGVPVPAVGEVLVKVAYAGVNRPDCLQRSGRYPPPPGASPILGLEASGHVVALGEGVTQWKLGDALCGLANGGAYAEYVNIPAGQALPIPAGLSLLQAAALPENYFTVWTNVFQRGRLQMGETFLVHKLRTMRIDAEASGPQWSKVGGDSRVTFVGRFLRKFRIDEIPQLWNILRGEMSFVGPRPERPEFTEELAEQIPFFRERLLLRPGLTGWAQVCYPYGSSVDDARRKLEFDLYYIKHMSLSLDAFILLDTVKTVVRGGASERRGVRLAEFEDVHRRVSQEVLALRASRNVVSGLQPVLMD